MPIRRAMELRVKTLVINALGALYSLMATDRLSSFRYDLRESGSRGVSIMTHLWRRSVVVLEFFFLRKPSLTVLSRSPETVRST